jgi:hypothetical protein
MKCNWQLQICIYSAEGMAPKRDIDNALAGEDK